MEHEMATSEKPRGRIEEFEFDGGQRSMYGCLGTALTVAIGIFLVALAGDVKTGGDVGLMVKLAVFGLMGLHLLAVSLRASRYGVQVARHGIRLTRPDARWVDWGGVAGGEVAGAERCRRAFRRRTL